jgi:hypothetical protein
MRIPQADDLVRIMDLPLAIDEGIDTASKIAVRYDFKERQAEYYLEAAEILGLVKRAEGKLTLSSDGRQFLKLDNPQRKSMLIKKIVVLPIITEVIAELISNDAYAVSEEEIAVIVTNLSGITGSTVRRRAHTIMAWLKWVGQESGVFQVTPDSVKLLVTPRPN